MSIELSSVHYKVGEVKNIRLLLVDSIAKCEYQVILRR